MVKKQNTRFDANIKQRVEMDRIVGGKRYMIAHIFNPVLDEDYFEYERRKKNIQRVFGTTNLSIIGESQNLGAAAWLWNKLITKREGYEAIDNWKDTVAVQEKNTAIEGLLGAAVVEGDDAEIVDARPGELLNPNLPELNKIQLEVFFNTKKLITTHSFQTPSAQDVEEFQTLLRQSATTTRRVGGVFKTQNTAVITVSTKVKQLCGLYDKLIQQSEGYVDRVPAYHKDVLVGELFSQELELREKN